GGGAGGGARAGGGAGGCWGGCEMREIGAGRGGVPAGPLRSWRWRRGWPSPAAPPMLRGSEGGCHARQRRAPTSTAYLPRLARRRRRLRGDLRRVRLRLFVHRVHRLAPARVRRLARLGVGRLF